jgi:hypothetical protein
MSNESKKAVIDLAALTKKYNAAAKKVAELEEDAKPEVREKLVEEVNKALAELEHGKKNTFVKVKFLKTPTGRYNLAYTKGESGSVNLSLAEAMEEEGYCAIKADKAQSIDVTDPQEETGKEE